MAKKKVTYRPGKVQGVFGVIWGAVFVIIGLVVAIPHFGAFGLLWTLLALAITGYNAYLAFGKGKVGRRSISRTMPLPPHLTRRSG